MPVPTLPGVQSLLHDPLLNQRHDDQQKSRAAGPLGSDQAISSSMVWTGMQSDTPMSSGNEQPARNNKLGKRSSDTPSSYLLPKRPQSSKPEKDNAEVTEGPAPELDLAEIMEGLKRQNISRFQIQLLERTYFVFHMGEDVWSRNLGGIIANAINAVYTYINYILPTVSVAQIHKVFLELLHMEGKASLMGE